MWSCGCIFAELYTRRALFMGHSEQDQLLKIFEVIGIPEQVPKWLLDGPLEYKSMFNKLANKPKIGLDSLLTMMDPDGLDLLRRLLEYDLDARISAHDALKHPYFERAIQNATASSTASAVDEQSKPQLLPRLPDITNLFQQNQQQQAHVAPNILKRKRILNNNNNNLTAQNK